MLEWLTVLLVVSPFVAVLVYLERHHAPRWQIWAVWIGSPAIFLGVVGASLYHFQVGYIVAFFLLGAMAGAVAAFTPFKTRTSRRRVVLPSRTQRLLASHSSTPEELRAGEALAQRSVEAILNEELVLFLECEGVPTLVTKLVWLTRTVQWETAVTLASDVPRIRSMLVSWFANHDGGKFVQSRDHAEGCEVHGVLLVGPDALGSRVPKLVLVTLNATPEGAHSQRTHVTVQTRAKVGRLSPRKVTDHATAACMRAATDVVTALATLAAE